MEAVRVEGVFLYFVCHLCFCCHCTALIV